MRIQQAVSSFTANGQVGPWLKHDFYETPFDLSLLVAFATGPGATLLAATLSIDYIVDNFCNDGQRQVFASQAGSTTLTIAENGPILPTGFGGGLGHGLVAGDVVEITGTPGGASDGIWPVATVTNATTYTLTTTNSPTFTSVVTATSGRVVTATATDKIIPIAGVTARTGVNVASPIVASRLHVTAFTTAGLGILVAVQGGVSS